MSRNHRTTFLARPFCHWLPFPDRSLSILLWRCLVPRCSHKRVHPAAAHSICLALSKRLGWATLHSEGHDQNSFYDNALLDIFSGFPFSFDLSVVAVSNTWLLMGTSCLLCMLSFALLGIRGAARLPYGLKILQFFFSRGSNTCHYHDWQPAFGHWPWQFRKWFMSCDPCHHAWVDRKIYETRDGVRNEGWNLGILRQYCGEELYIQ